MKRILMIMLILLLMVSGCSKKESANDEYVNRYKNKSVQQIVDSLTLEQKAAQMVQPAIYNVSEAKMQLNCYGSILSKSNSVDYLTWQGIVDRYQEKALKSASGIPYLYGQDDVHGVNYAKGTVIFPHNIGLGAANDPELMYEVGLITADEAKLCHMLWNFAPCVAQSVDPRWGRTYESYGSDLEIIKSLSTQYTKGLIDGGLVGCAKHFFADGNVQYGTGEKSDVDRIIDRGDATLTEEEIKELLDVYKQLIDTGVQTIMISHSSLNGVKMHENAKYIQYLKNEMGFEGFVVSDWNSIQNISADSYKQQVITAINSGIDMLMEPDKYDSAMNIIVAAVNSNEISMERVDDAVARIIKVKLQAGIFDDPYFERVKTVKSETGSKEYRAIAEKLVEESLVLIKNKNDLLPLKSGMTIYMTGPALDNARIQCGGWTIDWNGSPEDKIDGVTTILAGFKEVAEEMGITITTRKVDMEMADAVVLCLGEESYAEWNGDTEDLDICGSHGSSWNAAAIERAKLAGKPIVCCIVAGRNVIIKDYIDDWDAVVMCYLPGSEGKGVANVLCGKANFTGKLPANWYDSVDKIEGKDYWLEMGYGLEY